MRARALIALIATALARPALADDGYSQVGAGGIVFAKSADIAMAREDLYISPEKVRVRFVFVNQGPKDIDAVVAFPLPDLEPDQFETPSGSPPMAKDPVNFVGFTLRVDGKPVAMRAEQKAIFKNKDVTASVRAAGLPLNLAVFDKYYHGLDGTIPAAKQDMLERRGIVDRGTPLWIVQTRFYWTQHFPTAKAVIVDHEYRPLTGESWYYDNRSPDARGDNNPVKAFCIDGATQARLADMRRHTKIDHGHVHMQLLAKIVDYVLGTARTWKGPIGHFHMTLDKRDPGAALTLCWPGKLKKSGPATFDFDADNFTPRTDVHMAVIADPHR